MIPHTQLASKLTRWVLAPGDPVISERTAAGLFMSLPIFFGGVINSVVVAALAATRHPTTAFYLWLGLEALIGLSRLITIIVGRRALRRGAALPTTTAIILAWGWAAATGFGAYITIESQDWVLATIVCLSSAGMVAGICLRNFGTPRLAATMMMLSLLPSVIAALRSTEGALTIIAVQLPIYMLFVGAAAFRLNKMMVGLMTTQAALEKSDAFNRSVLESSPDYTIILDDKAEVIVCHRPRSSDHQSGTIVGVSWFQLLPPSKQEEGQQALELAARGEIARMLVSHDNSAGTRWFDLAISQILDGSGHILIVARDATHQKKSEEHALWMANHDALTKLPNRVVLQNRLESVVECGTASALLVLDIDNFKLINDTLGHDAGDALLCTVANRLRSSVRPDDLVTRLGGDEFAIVIAARNQQELEATAEKILGDLRLPFVHNGRLLECNASIGASQFPRDGGTRAELMKAADVALYAAKTGGRGRLKVFKSEMRNDFQRRNSMVSLARRALDADDVKPHYQPKVCLETGEIKGFEALLRWRDPAGDMRLPGKLEAAFDDPALSSEISIRMIDRVLADASHWLNTGIEFGHVAINAAAPNFYEHRFVDMLLEKMARAGVPARCLQLEVTETVFLGRGAEGVGRALRQVDEAGIRVALDDFGTGYASLSHLMQFPVHALKIDRSFVREIGRKGDAEAITKAIVRLGRSLDLEIIAEGVETVSQQAYLSSIGCHTAQGYLYSKAVPHELVVGMLSARSSQTCSA